MYLNGQYARRILILASLLIGVLALSGCAGDPADVSGGDTLSLPEILYRLVVGGPSISEATLIRFYAWHVMGLGLPLLILVAWHGFRVRRDGGISSPERGGDDPPLPRVDRAVLVQRDWLTFFLTLASIILISVFVDPPLGPAAEPGALVEHTQAPWIFLWVQELLRIWPPAIAGVITPMVVLLLLTFLPYLDWSNEGIALWFNRQGRIPQILLILMVITVTVLTILAALR